MDRDKDLWDKYGNPHYHARHDSLVNLLSTPPLAPFTVQQQPLRQHSSIYPSQFLPQHSSIHPSQSLLRPSSIYSDQLLPQKSTMLQQLLSQDQPWLMSQPQSTFQSGQQDTAHNVTRFQLSSRLSPDTQTSTGSGHLKDTPPNAPVPQGHSISQPRFNFQAFFDDLRKGDTETPQPKTSPVSVQYHSSDTPQTGFQDNPPLSIDTLESMYLTPLSERPRLSGIWLDNNEAAESTDLRTQLLSRKYFIFDLSKSMIFIAKAYGDAYLSVFVHIQCIQPKLSIQELMDKYVQLVAAELESPLENYKSFEYLLISRFMKLLHSLEIDLIKVPDNCRKLVSIFNSRVIPIQRLGRGLELLPLFAHLGKHKKKIALMFNIENLISNIPIRGHIDLLSSEILDAMHTSNACMLSRVPIYTSDISKLLSFGRSGDILDGPEMVAGAPMFERALVDLPCSGSDMVFISDNAHYVDSIELQGLVSVHITGSMKKSDMSPVSDGL